MGLIDFIMMLNAAAIAAAAPPGTSGWATTMRSGIIMKSGLMKRL